MVRRGWWLGILSATVLLIGAGAWAAEPGLSVVKAGPEGEIANLGEINEIRVLFSEPMVALGRIPDLVTAPFFRVEPAISGTFRWSGTRLLIFTPDHEAKLPYCTRYRVTVDGSATAVSGNRLGKPFVFSFTTPTVRLLNARWYRKTGRYDSPAVLALRFNQPVSPEAVAKHMALHYLRHDWEVPSIQREVMARIARQDPQSFIAFQKKVALAAMAANSSDPVAFVLAADWDKERFKPGDDLVVVETSVAPPPQSAILAEIDDKVPGAQGRETPATPQSYQFYMEPAFFVNGLYCTSPCSVEYYNSLIFRTAVSSKDVVGRLSAWDTTDPSKESALTLSMEKAKAAQEEETDEDWVDEEHPDRITSRLSLDTLGLELKPARTYVFKVDSSLMSTDGQALGYNWYGQVEYWHNTAFISFGTGHGVWEASGGAQLPFYSRNVTDVKEWFYPLPKDELVPAILQVDRWCLNADGTPQHCSTNPLPSVAPTSRSLPVDPDVIGSYGINMARALDSQGKGLAWLGLQVDKAIDRSYRVDSQADASLIQVTNLGITVKDSPLNTLIMVTRLDDGAPVEGADVELRTLDNNVFWRGATDAKGVAIASDTDLRTRLKVDEWSLSWVLAFVVTASKDGDFAYVCSDWNDGIRHWDFNVPFNLEEAKPLLRGSVFPDRGVYKLGEEIHFKAILRSDTAKGMTLLPAGAKVTAVLTDSQDKEIDKRELTLSEWDAADWTVTLPQDGSLGRYTLEAAVEGQNGSARATFLVAAYRKPDFRVDVNVGGTDDLAGATLKGAVTGRYLFGAPMADMAVRITYSKRTLNTVPDEVADKFPPERYAFLMEAWRPGYYESESTLFQRQEKLGEDGVLKVDLPTEKSAGRPYAYTLEGEVTDVSRQTIAGSASFPVHPAPWYLGLKRPDFFIEAKDGLHSEVVAVTPRGDVAPGVKVAVTLTQVQWNSVRRAEGNGMYAWESQRVEKERWKGEVATADKPVPIDVELSDGGFYILGVAATDEEGRATTTETDFYVLGPGYTAWERYDNNRIDLVPEKQTYRPGETARIMIKSPWEKATALLTTEREGIRTHEEFELTSTMQTVSVPITEAEIPNVFVSVLLVKGRTSATLEKDGSDPGKPTFRLGYVQLKVENRTKRLSVDVKSDREEYRPAAKASITVDVKDVNGKPVQGEVTLWAVDYGVLSLTGYKTPDVLAAVWVDKALQVMNEDSRQNIVSRRVITPKGAEDGGGGGMDEGVENKARKDFRVLAFWLGSAVTDAKGHLATQQKLPESLTTYRVMAVVQDKSHRFGWGEREIRLSKPVLLTAAFPRFLALGDKAAFGAVVHSLLKEPGSAMVTMKSLTPDLLEVEGDGVQNVAVKAKGTVEVRFPVRTKAPGTAKLLMAVKLLGEEDAFELPLPVEVLSSPEVVAAYGIADREAKETVVIPEGVVPGLGGLHLELSSTAMVGLGEGARYLVDYPYGCAEQRASCALALLLTSDLGGAFSLPDIEPAKLREVTQTTLKDLEDYQCSNGGFVYWKGGCPWTSAYLTSYIVHVYQRARLLGYTVDPEVVHRACDYLEQEVARTPPPNEGFMPAYTAWQAFAVKVLAEEGRTVDSHITRLYGYRDRMPVFGLCHLGDAMKALGEKGERADDIHRRLTNAVLPEGGSAHVEELSDPYLLWFWNSTIRSTAIGLGSLVRNSEDAVLVPQMVRWLMAARKKGRWGNTQENAWAMESLVDYYKKYEKETPDFTGEAALGLKTLMSELFKGRDTKARISDLPMAALLKEGRPGEALALTFRRKGTGKLFYVARLKYASDELFQSGMDTGVYVKRRYEPVAGGAEAKRFKAGDLVRVVLDFDLTKERRWVAVTDPIPAGFEPVESWFATTARDLASAQEQEESQHGDWMSWWRGGGFDHVERHDDRVLLFATRLSQGKHTFSYVCRATTLGTFRTAPTHAEEMYEPEVFGRTATDVVEVTP
jgi:uncharacterized protein YfaS (alpha-2-macroglobulin family)